MFHLRGTGYGHFLDTNVAIATHYSLILALSGYYSRKNPVVYYGIVISMFRCYVLQSLKIL